MEKPASLPFIFNASCCDVNEDLRHNVQYEGIGNIIVQGHGQGHKYSKATEMTKAS